MPMETATPKNIWFSEPRASVIHLLGSILRVIMTFALHALKKQRLFTSSIPPRTKWFWFHHHTIAVKAIKWGPCRSAWHVGMLCVYCSEALGACSVACVVLLLPTSFSFLKLKRSIELLCKAWGSSSVISCFCPICVGSSLSVVGTPNGVCLWGRGFDPCAGISLFLQC